MAGDGGRVAVGWGVHQLHRSRYVLGAAVGRSRARALHEARVWRAVHRPTRVPVLQVGGTGCEWLSTDPPVLLAAFWLDEQHRLMYSLEPVFQRFRGRRLDVLLTWYWHLADPGRVRTIRRMEDAHRRRFPGHRFVHLCNSRQQLEAFRAAGLEAVLCSHNCFLDERLYRPLDGVEKRFDAVYNARLKGYKRHALAAAVDSLALVYARGENDDPAEAARILGHLRDAYFFNHPGDPDGRTYRPLSDDEVCAAVNQCRVGLCLSAVEGGMYASAEYLLCGVPVVSTPSLGGRDEFFDAGNSLIVEPTPDAVAEGVRVLAGRAPAAEVVRASALATVEAHRRALQDAVQAIYDREGAGRRFADEWPGLRYNRMHRFRSYEAILAPFDDPTASGA